MITLACKPNDSLDWDLSSIPSEGSILWRLDLGLEAPFFPLDDEMHFESLCLALKKFTQEIWPVYQERTEGAVIFQGSADLHSLFSWTEKQMQNWEIWREGRLEERELHLRRLFCLDVFSHYFQMLAHKLPDELPLFLAFDAEGLGSIAEKHHLLCRERFEHFQVATKNLPFTNGLIWDGNQILNQNEKSPRALCLPEDVKCSSFILTRLEEGMTRIEKPFRVISEAFLTEDWEGVDVLHVIDGTLSLQGERKIKGFEATGGVVVYTSLSK